MKHYVIALISILIPLTGFAEDQQVPTISSTCQITSIPGGRDGSTVEYTWKISAKASEDRVLSVYQLTRTHPEGQTPLYRGWQKFLYCESGSPHEKEIRLEVDQAPNGGERAFWFEGFLTGFINEDIPLPESATVSVTTRQISDKDEPGHLIDINVANKGRQLSRHFIFISFWSPADLQNALPPEASEEEREARDGNAWNIFTDPKGWEPKFRRFSEFDK